MIRLHNPGQERPESSQLGIELDSELRSKTTMQLVIYEHESDIPWKVGVTLGRGSYGHVEAVEDCHKDSQPGIVYARKCIRSVDDKDAVKDCDREFSNFRKVPPHRHFIELIEAYRLDYRYFLVTSPAIATPQKTMEDVLNYVHDTSRNGQSSRGLDGFNKIMLQAFGCLAHGLAFLHTNANMIHKDIKTSNILVDGNRILYSVSTIFISIDLS